MSRDEKDAKAIDSKEELKMANERRIEELLNINNRCTNSKAFGAVF